METESTEFSNLPTFINKKANVNFKPRQSKPGLLRTMLGAITPVEVEIICYFFHITRSNLKHFPQPLNTFLKSVSQVFLSKVKGLSQTSYPQVN